MSALLELDANCLHCCFKVMAAPKDGQDRVATWVRSEPLDGRDVEAGEDNAHFVNTNSVWSALYGCSDGKTHWYPFTCFCCNDLPKWGNKFVCDRKNWSQFYKSTLVVPIRLPKDKLGMEYENIGFLAYDSPHTGVFLGMPDIFDYRENPTGYRDALENSTAFHFAGIIADTMATALSTAYTNRTEVAR